MKSDWVWSGIALIIVAIILTIFSFSFAIICTGPMFLIGIILFSIGLIMEPSKKNRYCPGCGRGIPFDAQFCPYCGKRF